MEVGVIGSSVWQQNMPLLESLTLDREDKINRLHELKSSLKISELIYLATCNRVEFIYASPDKVSGDKILHRLIDFFFGRGREINFFPNDFYHYAGREAINHVFRTVSSLESLVVGETQITGQFKSAYQDATGAGLAGPFLCKLAEEALLAAKRIRRETQLGRGAQSMASLANNELLDHLKNLKDPLIALIGAGEMTHKFAKYVRKSGIGRLLFVNRTVEKAEKLAEEYGGNTVSLNNFLESPSAISAIVSATASPEPIFDRNFVERLNSNSEKPVLCIDLAIPRDFAESLKADGRVKLVDIPSLKAKSNGNLREKFIESSKANEILKESVHKFLSSRMEVSIKPIFQESYEESLRMADEALSDLFANRITSLKKDEKEAVARLVKRIVGHSSFQPARILSECLTKAQAQLDPEAINHTNKNVG